MSKRYLTSPITTSALAPLKTGTVNFLQDAHKDDSAQLALAMIQSLTNGSYSTTTAYALWGCTITEGGSFRSIAPGAIFYNGEIYEQSGVIVPGVSSNIVGNFTTSYFTDPTADPVTLSDTTTHNMHQIKTIDFSAGTSGSGLFDYVDMVFLIRSANILQPVQMAEPSFTTYLLYMDTSKVINFASTSVSACTVQLVWNQYTPEVAGTRVLLQGLFSTPTLTVTEAVSGTTTFTNIGTIVNGSTLTGGNYTVEIQYMGINASTGLRDVYYRIIKNV